MKIINLVSNRKPPNSSSKTLESNLKIREETSHLVCHSSALLPSVRRPRRARIRLTLSLGGSSLLGQWVSVACCRPTSSSVSSNPSHSLALFLSLALSLSLPLSPSLGSLSHSLGLSLSISLFFFSFFHFLSFFLFFSFIF